MKKLKLIDYINALERSGILITSINDQNIIEKSIDCLTYDTRDISENALFVCKGVHFKEEYLKKAFASGAVAYVSEKEYDGYPYGIIVSDIRKAIFTLAPLFYDNAPSKIVSVGITGTKGKSTTAYYMRAILDAYFSAADKPRCAIISSIDTYDGVENFESHLTTPEPFELYKHFNNAYESGISHLVMEVSSQALKYGRVSGINFDVACFTNIGTDHISPIEHTDFEDYFSSKLRIFDQCRAACINSDSDHYEKIRSAAAGKCRIITFGSHSDDDIYCSGYEKRDEATYFHVKTPTFEREMCITMPGIFNISNALAAIAMSYVLNIPEQYVYEGLLHARAGGRMQVYKSRDERVVVIVDYAHNKMSFEALYSSTQIEYPGRKMIAVFGCPGYKAYLRRKDLPEAADKYCDHVILTEEDSGEEPFESIAKDISANITKCTYDVIEDRIEAIRRSIFEVTDEKRVILLTGKGEETRMKRGTEYVDFPSDVEITLKILEEYDNAAVPAN